MTLERETTDGACNEPQPYNWRASCRLRPGHTTEHRAPIVGGWVYRWSDDATWRTEPGRTPFVRHRKRLGRRHYVKPALVGQRKGERR